ncbi:MAG: isoprenylcysteine carboxylmethyltransferase family protein [Gemmatimonadales bacterium]|nr:isoprenylcysteine carboxylmethyltransferase family protein [Gemmatimonadales bacterium]
MQYAGILLTLAGAVVCVACILTFVTAGRGTPAPFDPPRRLVVRGPYRIIRNPMYLGAAMALGGAAAYYGSLPLLAYAIAFLVAMHLFVVLYEEPTLRSTFGASYAEYCNRTGRWLVANRPDAA